MEKKVFDYIKDHPGVSHLEVAKALRISDLEARAVINRMMKEGILKYSKIIPLSETCDNSLTYEVRKQI